MTDVKDLNLDVSPEISRALHRVVRAMHDGNCPSCGYLGPSGEFFVPENPDACQYDGYHWCPKCGFKITHREASGAMEAFRPHMVANLQVFEQWRAGHRFAKAEQPVVEESIVQPVSKEQSLPTDSVQHLGDFYSVLGEIRRIASQAEETRWQGVESRFVDRIGSIARMADVTMGHVFDQLAKMHKATKQSNGQNGQS